MEPFAAGLIPYFYNGVEIYFLLGLERSNQKWSGFVGGSERGETKKQTAMREFNEETTLIFENIPLQLGTPILEKTSTGKKVYLYFVKFPEKREYRLNTGLTDKKYKEKEKLKWFSLDQIKKTNTVFRKLKQTILTYF